MTAVRALSRIFVLETDRDRQQMLGYLAALPLNADRQKWRVTIEPDTETRTLRQNIRMWAIFRYIADNAWVEGQRYSADAWHAHYCGEFIGWEDLPGGGRQSVGSSGLSTKAHAQFTDRVQADAAMAHGVDWSHWEEARA